MQTNSFSTFLGGISAAYLLTVAIVSAADVNGSWSWTMPGRNGGPDRTSKLTLKAEGAKLTGKVVSPGREGATTETAITEGKLDGDKVTFDVIREWNGNSNTNHYSGKLAGDKITGKIEFTRQGEKQSRDWEAKRVTDAK